MLRDMLVSTWVRKPRNQESQFAPVNFFHECIITRKHALKTRPMRQKVSHIGIFVLHVGQQITSLMVQKMSKPGCVLS